MMPLDCRNEGKRLGTSSAETSSDTHSFDIHEAHRGHREYAIFGELVAILDSGVANIVLL